MTIGTLSPRPKKPKFSNCSVSNEISGEDYLRLVWVWYGIIFSRNTSQSYLFMTQVDFMLFLRLWVRSIQALPNLVRSFPNPRFLSQNSPNIYMKSIQGIFNLRNIFFNLILNPPLDSSACFNMKNNEFHRKTFSNLVFGDDFTFARTKWKYHDFFYVLISKFQSMEFKIML